MRILAFSCIYILSSLSSLFLYAQDAIFEFEDGVCLFQGTFDSKKYTKDQLANTYRLIQGGAISLYTDEETELDEGYKIILDDLNNTKFVETPFFKTYKDSLIHYVNQTYKLRKVQFEAIRVNKKALMQHYQDDPTIKMYSEALVKGGKDLIQAYEYLTKKQMKNNSDPDRIWRNYSANITKDNAQKLAFNYVLVYGWWNAVNHQIEHIYYDGRHFEEFMKLFITVKTIDCDEV